MTTETVQHPVIAMDAVESSQIAAIGHDPSTQTMAIKFPDKGTRIGSLYHYANVTAEQFAEFKAAESKGSHFIKSFKSFADKFPYTKIS